MIFPIVFANGLDPADGPGLVFNTLPVAFGQMPFGVFFGTVFFILLVFAAWTSALGLMEPAVAWLIERHHRTRAQAAFMVGGLIWAIGFGTVLSFNVLADFYPLSFIPAFADKTIYDNVDYITSNVMLPLGGVFITVFAAWVMCRNSSAEELGGAGTMYTLWRFLAQFVAPVAIVFVFLQAIGVL